MADDNRGLASADEDTKERVAKEGGEARKAQGADYSDMGKKGGKARANDPDVQSGELGRQGAEARWNDDK